MLLPIWSRKHKLPDSVYEEYPSVWHWPLKQIEYCGTLMPHSSPGDNGSQDPWANSVSFRGGLNCSDTLITALLVPALCCPKGTLPRPSRMKPPGRPRDAMAQWGNPVSQHAVGLSCRVGQQEWPRESQEVGEMRRSRPPAHSEEMSHFARSVSSLWAASRGSVVPEGKRCLRYSPCLCSDGGDRELGNIIQLWWKATEKQKGKGEHWYTVGHEA